MKKRKGDSENTERFSGGGKVWIEIKHGTHYQREQSSCKRWQVGI